MLNLALVGLGHKMLRCVTAPTSWAGQQVGEKGSIDYETDVIKSGRERKAFKLLFSADVAAEDFLLRLGGLISVSFAWLR